MRHVINTTSYSGIDCFFSSVINILLENQYYIRETDLFFYCNGLRIEYALDLNQIHYLIFDVFRRLKCKSIVVKTSYNNTGNAGFINNVCRELDNNRTVLLCVSTAKLTYHEAYRGTPDRTHFILLHGIDSDRKLAYIYDCHIRGYGPILTYKGKASLQDIIDATHYMFWFVLENSRPITKKETFEKAIKHLRRFLEGQIVDNKYYGMAALEKYVDDFSTLLECENPAFTELCATIHYKIRAGCFMTIIEYMINLISENQLFQNGGYLNILEELRYVHHDWERVGLGILKAGMSGKRTDIANILERSKKILAKQKSVFEHVLAHWQALLNFQRQLD